MVRSRHCVEISDIIFDNRQSRDNARVFCLRIPRAFQGGISLLCLAAMCSGRRWNTSDKRFQDQLYCCRAARQRTHNSNTRCPFLLGQLFSVFPVSSRALELLPDISVPQFVWMTQQNLVRFQHEVLHEPGVIVLHSLDGVQVRSACCASASTNSRSLIIDSPAPCCAAPPTWPTSAAAQVAVAPVQARLRADLLRQRSGDTDHRPFVQ
jgi:hypothetical protein